MKCVKHLRQCLEDRKFLICVYSKLSFHKHKNYVLKMVTAVAHEERDDNLLLSITKNSEQGAKSHIQSAALGSHK